MKTTPRSKSGFTLIELLVAMSIFVFLAMAAMQIFFFILNMQRDISTQKKLQDETRFLIERMVKEYRNGTIDFAQYYLLADPTNNTYEDYVNLAADEDVGEYVGNITVDTSDGLVEALYIIYPAGNERTVFFLTTPDAGCASADIQTCLCDPAADEDSDGEPDGCDLAMRKEVYDDYDADPATPSTWEEVTWEWASNHFALTEVASDGDGTEILNSNRVRIMSLDFLITPHKDPFKFYADRDILYHPMSTISMTTSYVDPTLDITPVEIQTSVSSRLYREVEWTDGQ